MTLTKQTQKIFQIMFVGWLVVVVLIHLTADFSMIPVFPGFLNDLAALDWLWHFLLIGFIGFFTPFIPIRTISLKTLQIPLTLLILIVAVIIEESTQIFRVNRGFSFIDMTANVLGLIFYWRLMNTQRMQDFANRFALRVLRVTSSANKGYKTKVL